MFEIIGRITHYIYTSSILLGSHLLEGVIVPPASAGRNLVHIITGGKMKIKFLTFLSLAIVLLAACGKNDADVQKAVAAKFAADNVTGVTVAVKDGVATLTGEVADITVKNKAEASARAVEGVKSVVNNTTLKPLPVATPSGDDQTLKGKIEENFKKAGCDGATVEVKDGVATVRGSVPDAKYAECVKVVQESGALKPVNLLEKSK